MKNHSMKTCVAAAFAALVLGVSLYPAATFAGAPEAKGKTCRMEQQCRWENFKKICVYVKVCR